MLSNKLSIAFSQAILEQESRIAGFKGEVAKSQELHLASLSRDTERLTNSLEKMRAEIKCAPCHNTIAPQSHRQSEVQA